MYIYTSPFILAVAERVLHFYYRHEKAMNEAKSGNLSGKSPFVLNYPEIIVVF
jgi:hypothetical protein